MKRTLLALCFVVPALSFAQASLVINPVFSSNSPTQYQIETPPIPKTDWEGNPITARLAAGLPNSERFGDLSMKPLGLPELCAKENQPTQIYWHQGELGPNCHYVDLQGNDWFGWQEDAEFYWVLAAQGAFWALDSGSGRWLGYAQGNWWWKGNDSDSRLMLYRNGTYYLCDARGNIIDSKGERPGELKGDYDGPYRGDSMSRQVFYHPGVHSFIAASGGHGAPPSSFRPISGISFQTIAWSRP
jgi:hypothetical protein